MGKKRSPWAKEAYKSMIDRDLDTKDVAEMTGYDRRFIANVLNSDIKAPIAKVKISRCLNIRTPDEMELESNKKSL